MVKQLQKKNYFVELDSGYKLSDSLGVFLELQQFGCSASPAFRGVTYDRKLSEQYNVGEIVSFLSRFVSVAAQKPVWLVQYSAVAPEE